MAVVCPRRTMFRRPRPKSLGQYVRQSHPRQSIKVRLILKNLYLYKLDKERKNQFLSQEDKYIYKRVKKLLGEEFSIVLNINQEEADNKIKSFIIR